MKTDTPSLETPQAARLRRRQLIRQLLERDKTPLAILFMAAVVGTLVGLAAVAFDKGVAWLQNQRMGALVKFNQLSASDTQHQCVFGYIVESSVLSRFFYEVLP